MDGYCVTLFWGSDGDEHRHVRTEEQAFWLVLDYIETRCMNAGHPEAEHPLDARRCFCHWLRHHDGSRDVVAALLETYPHDCFGEHLGRFDVEPFRIEAPEDYGARKLRDY